MQKLEEIAIKSVFETYLINKSPNSEIKNLFMQYLSNNKELVDDYLLLEPLYHVYLRHQDSACDSDNETIHQLYLIQSFATLESATKWIFENGKDIIDAEKENQDRTMVLTIIDRKGGDISNYDYPMCASSMFMIATKKYPTYAFCKDGFKMLLDEHKRLFIGDWTNTVVPSWIYWIKSPDNVIQGCSKSYMNDLVDRYMDKYRDAARKKASKEFAKLKNPPK
jgi:hypothetical protein